MIAIAAGEAGAGPYARQVAEQVAGLGAEEPWRRAWAAEALGWLRAYEAEGALVRALGDRAAAVRCQAALALGWCGSRRAVQPLIEALDDTDWTTAQAAWVALTNLTGMEYPFDALAAPAVRAEQASRWRRWWAAVPRDRPPPELLELLAPPDNAALGCPVTASSTYKGPPTVLTDGRYGPAYWQTKNVPFPQSCTVDLGQPVRIDQVTVYQYGPRFVLTDYAVETSVDGRRFELVRRGQGPTPVELTVNFPARPARYVRITSFSSVTKRYPTTFFEIEVRRADRRVSGRGVSGPPHWRALRAMRALGALGGSGTAELLLDYLVPLVRRRAVANPAWRPVVRAGIRALGRQRGDRQAFEALVGWLDDTELCRFAAEALGDLGDRRAVPALLAAYPHFARGTKNEPPERLPADDDMKFPNEDRMYETPYQIIYALSRLPLEAAARAELRRLTPLLLANLPGDHDAAFLYEPEVGQVLTAYLLERAGLRQEACEFAFERLGQPRRVPKPKHCPPLPVFQPYRMSTWLSALCRDRADVPRLVALLDHENGWVRLNAAKALGLLGDRSAVEPIARRLAAARPEADYGYSGTFKDEEYNDPAPRYREGLVRALGMLGAAEQVPLLARVLDDERSVLEVRRAAAQALAQLGTESALAVLAHAARAHPFLSVRQVAAEALWTRAQAGSAPFARLGHHQLRGSAAALSRRAGPAGFCSRPACPAASGRAGRPLSAFVPAVVFIKGENQIPNTEGTVEQADRWFQTYVVTDSGPAYRPGRNLYVLAPPQPDGAVRPLTHFTDGYVADVEVSWDGRRLLFSRRGQHDPWWHLFEINADGTGLRQLTSGPYHDVGPAYLPDGRIVFASSRLGIRDEYHGYPCTSLHVMNPDGTGLHPIAVNIGRDNEPAVLADGRIVFSRLEVFYSRLKTELTLHAVRPDGTTDVVLYGPERRRFWRSLDVGPRTPAHGQEVPLTHRVLRMSQPQPMPDGLHIVCSTQGGLTLIGPQRNQETIIPHDKMRAFTSPYPLPDGRLLCSSTYKATEKKDVDLGIYLIEPATGRLTLVYNDPATADFEARPLLPRPRPPVLAHSGPNRSFTGRFACMSVFTTQEPEVPYGRLVRVVEGLPVVSRHSTQTNPWPVWKNHHGTLARVLGTVPLAADGSFFVEVPADRLLHFQVLDSDRRVVGNQITWISVRPGETRSCVGCHERPHWAASSAARSLTVPRPPAACLPGPERFRYRAKAWFKGHLPAPIEQRTRTVRAVNLLAR